MIGRCGIRTGARGRPCDPLFSTGFLLRVADALSPAKARRVSDCLDTIRNAAAQTRPLKSYFDCLVLASRKYRCGNLYRNGLALQILEALHLVFLGVHDGPSI